jgi:tripartite-type tricarboxylate transporter receptor subunit TctC
MREETMRRLPRAAAVAAVMMAICGHALAQDYPTRTVTLVVPYPPGGGVDAMARVVAEKLAGALGQQVVVDNRAGGSGLVGTRAFIKSPADRQLVGKIFPTWINPLDKL